MMNQSSRPMDLMRLRATKRKKTMIQHIISSMRANTT
jgi:hypothetical protein